MQVKRNCDYLYLGKRYSREGLIRAITINPPGISVKAKELLRSKLGMQDSEIEIVKGLIDAKAIGRFRADASILLSGFAIDQTAYHEAFHRVYRSYLTPDERLTYAEQFKERYKWESKLDPYRKLYPKATIDELIEEKLADDFANYILNPGNTRVVNRETKTIFDRLVNFIKKILGLKPKQINDLYTDIVAGKYKGRLLDKSLQYTRSADKVIVGENTYTADVKNEFISAVARDFIGEVLNQGSIYSLIKNGIEESLVNELYQQSFTTIAEALVDEYPDMINDFVDDYNKGGDSYLNSQFKQYFESLIGKFNLNLVEDSNLTYNEETGEVNREDGREQDDASPAWTASIEIDPKTSMSKAIKILLASLEDPNKVSSIGLNSQVRWTKAFNRLAQHLAGIPTQDSISHLAKLASSEPWVNDLIERIGGLNPKVGEINDYTARLRNEFIKTFAKTQNTYMMLEVNAEGIKMFDANQNTYEKKKMREWNSSMSLAIKNASDSGSFDEWLNQVKQLVANRNANEQQYKDLLGIDIDESLKNQPLFSQNGQDYYYLSAMNSIANNIINASTRQQYSNEKLPDFNNLFGANGFNIEGTVKNLVEAQSEYEDVVDLMVYSRDKKLYGISLNTHTTNTINTLNYVADLIDPKSDLNTKLKVIEQYLPNILNYQTIDKVNGEYVVKSKWLNHTLAGKKLKVVIMDGIKTNLGDSEATADINESDLYSITLNASVRGTNLSFKHSDRSTFYGYQMEGDRIFDYQDRGTNDVNQVIDYLTVVLQDQLATEVRRANLQNIPLFQYFKDKYKSSPLFALTDVTKVDPYSKEMESMIRSMVQTNFTNYKNELEKWNVLKVGVSPDLLAYHNGNVDLMVASSLANQMLTHLEEMKLMIGDFTFFKTADDFYKRMSTTSGTGDRMVNDQFTNDSIARLNQVKFTLRNPKTGELSEGFTYDKNVDGTFTSITLFEKDDYFSKDATELTEVSPISEDPISKLQYNFEWNMLKDFGPDVTIQQKGQIRRLAKQYADSYKNINENDGQAWINMFAFREYMTRQGAWTREMQNLFLAELKILNATSFDDIKNLTISMGGEEVKVFDADAWSNGWFESVHTLKGQYAGFTKAYSELRETAERSYNDRVRPYTIYKTSYHALWPSITFGRNLSQLHHFMLKNKIDVVHMNSANKSGAIDVQSVFAKENTLNEDQKYIADHGFNFYDKNGHFNDSAFDGELGSNLLNQSITLADFDSWKDQVRVGNKEKEIIKGSTQSLKIMLGNLIVSGEERFPGALDLVDRYKRIVADLVYASIDELKEELGFDGATVTKLDELVNTIKKAATDRSNPINVIEAIEGFLFDPIMESLPNKTKMENIFYSIITNNVISFDRPGNSYPQVASTGFESIGGREIGENNAIAGNDYLNFYKLNKDEEGNITSVDPSQITIPLPKSWIPEALRLAKTNNIAEAIEYLNNNIDRFKDQFTFKGLRIPNQALSSNDIVQVKEFTLPTNASFVVVPTNIVTKVGADFDIDSLKVYWKGFSNQKKTEKDKLFDQLLELEKDILLHPRNAHMFLTPLIDDLLKKEAFKEIVQELKGLPKESTSFMEALSPQKNVQKAIDFIKSKLGVGTVALDTTGHAVFQVDNVQLSKTYKKKGVKEPIPTNLMFDGLQNNYSVTAMYGSSGRVISEVQSQTMTSQVDAGKDPYAVQLGINSQTLGIFMYLVRRAVSPVLILKLLNQPIVQQYLVDQRNNESLINKQRGAELDKETLVKLVYLKNKLQRLPLDRTKVFTDEQLNSGIKNNTIDKLQGQMFEYFLALVDETAAFNDVKNSMTVDTKGRKDKASVEEFEGLQEKVKKAQLVNLDYSKTRGLLAPFFEAQKLYRQVYNPYYVIDNSVFGDYVNIFKDVVSSRQKGAFKKEKARNTIENDFLVFLIQNFNEDFTLNKFEEMFGLTNEQSISEQIKRLQKQPNQQSNVVLQALFPLVSVAKDTSRNKTFDVLRLFERELTVIDQNDFIDAMKDIRDENEDLYKSIIQLSIYQAGFLNSPFSLSKVFPTFKSTTRDKTGKLIDFQNDYMREIQLSVLKLLPKISTEVWPVFEEMFYRNNPTLAAPNYNDYSVIRYFYMGDDEGGPKRLFYKADGLTQPIFLDILGNTYFKQYFAQQAVGTSGVITKSTFNVTNMDEEGNVYDEYEDVTETLIVTPILQLEANISNNLTQTQIDEVSNMEQGILSNFEGYFPDWSFYNDEQRRIVAQSVSSGELSIYCHI